MTVPTTVPMTVPRTPRPLVPDAPERETAL